MKSKPQGLPLKIVFKTLRKKKVFFAIFLICIFIFAIFLIPQKNKSVKLFLTSEGTKFKINFVFGDKSRDDFTKVLDSVNVSITVLDGVEFELESTASSALTFAMPVEADLKINEKEILFSGSHAYPQIAKFDLATFKIPKDTSLAVFSQSAKEFLKNSQGLPFEFSGWLDENLNSSAGYYLSVFGRDSSVLVIFKPHKIDFDRLADLQFEDAETSSYKREKLADDTNVHFVKLDDSKNLSATIFEKDGWAYLIISKESPQEIIDLYLDNSSDFIEFPQGEEKSASFIAWFRNTGDYTAPLEFYRLLFGQSPDNVNTLEKIDEAQFFLLDNNFSGLIKYK